MRRLLAVVAAIALLGVAGAAAAMQAPPEVLVFDEAGYGGPIGAFYNGSYGGPASIAEYISGDLSAQSFDGVKLLWAAPADNFTPNEINAMASFLNVGGRIGFLGEWYGFAGARDESINAAVAGLGGHISINTNFADNGYPRYAYRSGGAILSDPFTQGVNSFVYGLFSPLSLGGSAKPLVLGENKSSVLLGYENIGEGTVFVMADQNPWDLDTYSAGTDTRTLFTNILTAPAVPEPAGMMALGTCVMGLLLTRRRRA